MDERNGIDFGFGPFERSGVLVAGCGEAVDGGADVAGAAGAESTQGFPRQDAEPDLHLVQPGGVGGCVVEVHIRVSGQPAVVLRLVGVEGVEDDVEVGGGGVSEKGGY